LPTRFPHGGQGGVERLQVDDARLIRGRSPNIRCCHLVNLGCAVSGQHGPLSRESGHEIGRLIILQLRELYHSGRG
jgi:hypothetical protein